jgi:dihydroxyacid dehydratase/phosphogluconate dehydratase
MAALIGLVREGDMIDIDIPNRTISCASTKPNCYPPRRAGRQGLEAGRTAQAQGHHGAEGLRRLRHFG